MMKFGRPWNVEGVRPRARETAHTAARRSHVTVGEWIDSAIIERAAKQGVDLPGNDGDRPREDVAAINDRLTHLTAQLDRIERTGGAQLDERTREDRDAIAHLDQRIDHVITESRFAVREIERRAMSIDQALNNLGRARLHGTYLAPASRPPTEPGADIARQQATDIHCAPSELQQSRGNLDLSRLEQQLVRISRQIDTVACSCHAEAVAEALRAGLADIKGIITATMPARALDAIENEMRNLVERLDADRDRGIDRAAFAGLERSLAEVRDELRRHAPVKYLAGFDEAVQTLSRKIDVIAAGLPDPGTSQRIDEALAAVRCVVSQLASNDALASVAHDVRRIVEMLERMASTTAQSASDHPGPTASARLENRITQLAQKVDASEARLTRLGSIERGLSELVQHLERIRARNAQAVNPAQTVVSGSNDAVSATNDEAVEALRRRVDALIQKRAVEQRTQSTPEAVQATVGEVAGRVAKVEPDVRQVEPPLVASEQTPVSRTPITTSQHEQPRQPKAMVRDYARDNEVGEWSAHQSLSAQPELLSAKPDAVIPDGAGPQTKETPKATAPIGASPLSASARPFTSRVTRFGPAFANEVRSARPMPLAATRLPIDPTLPPDTPLEPGIGKQRLGAVDASPIAAPPEGVSADDPDKTKSRAEFIAAARRAAQVAASGREDTKRLSEKAPMSAERTLTQRMKTLFFSGFLLVIVLTVSGVGLHHLYQAQPGTGFNHVGSAPPITVTPNELNSAPASVDTIAVAPGQKAVGESSTITSNPIATHESSSTAATSSQVLSDRESGAPNSTHGTSTASQSDVAGLTGVTTPSLAADVAQATSLSPATATVSAAEEGRWVINTASQLYAALSAGNPAAAYEMGSRFAEGRGVPVNFQQAALWFDRAAKAGSVPALFRLAVLYERGQGVAKDLQEARRLYVAAADKGHTKAMHNLAVMYVQGIDGKPDFATAARWFQKAANYAVVDSQYNLGVLLSRGVGVDRNLPEAYKWFALAAARGDREAANRRDDIAALLDVQSLNAARLAVQHFVPQTLAAEAITNPEPPGGWDQVVSGASSKSMPPGRVTAPQSRVIL